MEARAQEHESQIALSSGEEALGHAIKAAELYMEALRESPSATEKSRLSRKCQELLARAERLKMPASGASTLKEPRQARQLSSSEKVILLRASRLQGNVFTPWESPPGANIFCRASPDEPLYTDPATFALSARQLEVFAGWKRPDELFCQADERDDTGSLSEALMAAKSRSDFVQDITTDCSVVASLCAGNRHLGFGKDSLLGSLMHPFDKALSRPTVSETGKYVFRMHFNGCFRQVVVDDRLPSSSTERKLFVTDRRNPRLIWPALIEKAYLKVRGGYDFPGSNSGTDLSVLTGWIPEQVFLQSDDMDPDQVWNRIKKAFDFGDVMVTLGTGRLSREEETSLGLVAEHGYAVLNLGSDSGTRRMLLKNPWFDGLVWTGLGSLASKAISTTPTDEPPSENGLTGAFWIAFEDVLQNFESLYLNWSPGLFTERQDHHFSWDIPDKTVALTLAQNPQYSFRAQSDGSVWILLSRHFQDEELAMVHRRSNSTSLAAVSSQLGFTRLLLFNDTDGKRVLLPDGALQRGPYVDSPQTLLRLEAKRGVTYTVVMGQDGLPLPRYTFTLSFFSRTSLAVQAAPEPLRHITSVTGSWTRRTSGGNASSPSYFDNPQFRLSLPARSRLSLMVSTPDPDLPVHVALLWAAGRRATAISTRDTLASSGEYRRGCAVCAVSGGGGVDAGAYTVVVSTFDAGCLADFVLRVAADVPVEVAPVLTDAAGRLRTTLPLLVFEDDDRRRRAEAEAGEEDHPHGLRAARAALRVARLTKLSVVVTSVPLPAAGGSSSSLGSVSATTTTAAAAPSAVRVSVESGSGTYRAALAVTGDGEFLDAAMGLRTADVDVEPGLATRRAAAAAAAGGSVGSGSSDGGGLWIVVEQIGRQAAGRAFRVEVLSDVTVEVGGWEGEQGGQREP